MSEDSRKLRLVAKHSDNGAVPKLADIRVWVDGKPLADVSELQMERLEDGTMQVTIKVDNVLVQRVLSVGTRVRVAGKLSQEHPLSIGALHWYRRRPGALATIESYDAENRYYVVNHDVAVVVHKFVAGCGMCIYFPDELQPIEHTPIAQGDSGIMGV